ncbi:MAG TPA: hypothetical protein VE957_16265 [Terriglobales bacterium]|nr:hypothetical protein [Terriglobales bacterium]
MATDEQNPQITVYANQIRLALSFTDVKLFFGELIPSGPPTAVGEMIPAQIQAVDRVCITLSPEIVPALIDGLTKGIETYQAQFGPLRKVPQVMLQPPAPAAQPSAGESAKTWHPIPPK